MDRQGSRYDILLRTYIFEQQLILVHFISSYTYPNLIVAIHQQASNNPTITTAIRFVINLDYLSDNLAKKAKLKKYIDQIYNFAFFSTHFIIFYQMAVKQIEGYKVYMDKILGKGAYGDVYVGTSDNKHNEKVAVKVLPKVKIHADDYLKQAFMSEIRILEQVKSPNIVGFLEVMESSKNYYIIQELCDGDITSIMKPGKQIPQKDCVDMLKQLCNGFLAMVKEGIVHRDVKPANIMKKGNLLKIGDFGFAKKFEKNMATTVVGTPLYMSIQILKGEEYSSKCDIWALGFIFYELLHGCTPWTANTQAQLVQRITSNPLKIGRKDLSPVTEDFIRRCLGINEQDRISWDELFAHSIFNGFFNDKMGQNFENKLKQYMNDLRFYIKSKNLDLEKLLSSMGYHSQKDEMTFSNYFRFLQLANPEMKESEAKYIFDRTDSNKNGKISIQQIRILMEQHSISLTSVFRSIPSFEKDEKETFKRMSPQTEKKIHSLFIKLEKVILKHKLTLGKVFRDFDKDKTGKMSQKEFNSFIKKLAKGVCDVNDEEIRDAFLMIDEDSSNTIQFHELNMYYSKVNGIPEEVNNWNVQKMQIEYEAPKQEQNNRKPVQNPFLMINNPNQHFLPNQNQYPPQQNPYPQQYPQPNQYPPYPQNANPIMQFMYGSRQ